MRKLGGSPPPSSSGVAQRPVPARGLREEPPDASSWPRSRARWREGLAGVRFVAKASLWIRPEGGPTRGSDPPGEGRRNTCAPSPATPAGSRPCDSWSTAARARPTSPSGTTRGPPPSHLSPGKSRGRRPLPVEGEDAVVPEMELLIPFLRGSGIAVENVRQKQRIQRREHFATVGSSRRGWAHEVRNPAGVIQGAAQFLSREALPGTGSSWTSSWRRRTGSTASSPSSSNTRAPRSASRGQSPCGSRWTGRWRGCGARRATGWRRSAHPRADRGRPAESQRGSAEIERSSSTC